MRFRSTRARFQISAVSAALVLAPIVEARAQQLGANRVGLIQPRATAQRSESRAPRLRAPAQSFWREGGVVTALAAVIVVNIMASADGDSGGKVSIGDRVLYSALSGVVFFVPGALIGGLIPKK